MEQFTIGAVIAYLETTRDDEWCTGICRTKDQTQNCLLGHIFNMGKTDEEGNDWCDWFEGCVATTYMFFPINDGEDKNYPQSTPKERCLAYLRDLQSGKAKSVIDYLNEYKIMNFEEGEKFESI